MQPPRDEPLAIDPRLIHAGRTPSTPSQAFRAVSVPVGTRTAWPSVGGTSSPPPHSSEWSSGSSDAFEAILMRLETLEALTDDQDEKIASLEKKVERQDALLKRLVADEGWDADGEAEDQQQQQQQMKRKRRKVSATKILTKGNTSFLTEKQKKVRKELLSFVGIQLKALSGTPADSPLPPKDLLPGEQALPDGRVLLIPDFAKDVTDKNNERLISQAAYLVYREQSKDTSQLIHKDVEFTEGDVDSLAKAAFRNWKTAYVRETDMAAKAKAAVHAKKAARTQRKRQKKMDRLDMKEEYLVSYGADPSSLLLTDWMSEYMSDLEDGDDHQKHVHRIKMKAAAGLSLQNQDDDDVIWERVRPAFRSDKANTVYKRLDDLRKTSKRDTGKKNMSNKRVDLGRINNRIPVVPPYPFMVDTTWHKAHVEGKTLDEPFQTKREDPAGFGSKEQEVD